MADWTETLQRAATLSPEAARHLPALIQLLESVATGRATAEEVTAELGTIGARRPGLVEALDIALRSGRREQPGLAAARAVLAELPGLLDSIVAVPPRGADPGGEGGAVAILGHLNERERIAPDVAEHATLRCPRCGSRRIAERHTDEFERRYREVRCAECGNYDSWFEGDPEEAAWH